MTVRRVLITGASKGIGKALADKLADDGHEIIGVARTAPENFTGEFLEVDLGDRAATAQALSTIVAQPVDAVINNVGLASVAPIGSVDLDDLFHTYDMNVRTAVQVVQAALPGMLAAGWGRIVNITSLVTLGMPERTAYGAAKAALEACTRTWAEELATTGITVNAVAPGPVETELYRQRSPQGSERESSMLQRIPVRRVGDPYEIAHTISHLLDNEAGYLTGQIIRVDGGGSIGAS
jgi:NAD(P)-dependent dehydrogenase (short-subunit alcohol dehydrogenase family)